MKKLLMATTLATVLASPAYATVKFDRCEAGTQAGCWYAQILNKITPKDADRFIKLSEASDTHEMRVIIQGPGGNLAAALTIGEEIHAKGWKVLVPSNTECASACAMIYLADPHAVLGLSSRLMFHSASDPLDPSHADGTGDVEAGIYLAHMGYDYVAAEKIIGHGPEQYFVIENGANNQLSTFNAGAPPLRKTKQ
jgi:hypothetical protein